jgi:hypothetical protein
MVASYDRVSNSCSAIPQFLQVIHRCPEGSIQKRPSRVKKREITKKINILHDLKLNGRYIFEIILA